MKSTMRAMTLPSIVSLDEEENPLRQTEVPVPKPGAGEVLIRVSACGVCHTELDEIEGRTAPPHLPVIPGHEIVGRVAAVTDGVDDLQAGDRVGVGWIHHSSGDDEENLSDDFHATGRDVNGGYAEYLTVPSAYAYPIPRIFRDEEAAPLLCAGAIGYRALRLTGLENGERLGLTGFGGSAHLILQLTRHLYPDSPVFVFARDAETRAFARDQGAVWAGDTTERSPDPLHAVIDTTPAWKPVVEALANLRPGGRLVINAIRKIDADKGYLLNLSYLNHLWMERELKSVANITARDLRGFLPVAAEIPIRPVITTYPLAEANRALLDLHRKPVRGAKVLLVTED